MTSGFISRRGFVGATLAGAAALSLPAHRSSAQGARLKELKIGYQKNGILVIARQQATFENHFKKDGIDVKWVEFTAGPPMMEAMNAGSIDFGAVGDSPPIFAQAAGANIVYAAGQPITNGQGILVQQNSPIKTLADLKGKRIAFTRGSSANNVVLVALEKAGLSFGDITPVYLGPPEAGPAFANGTIDAWAIWDPYFAIAEVKQNARILINAHEIAKTNSFFIANRDFAKNNGIVLRDVIGSLASAAKWAESNRDLVGKSLADVTGIDLEIQTIAARRSAFVIGPITEDILTTQQAVADRYAKLNLIPRAINVREAVWYPPQA
jgi:sulfonate transport system substrate-binding protein